MITDFEGGERAADDMDAILDTRTEGPNGSFETATYPYADADAIRLLAGLRTTVRDLLLAEAGVGEERVIQMHDGCFKCNN